MAPDNAGLLLLDKPGLETGRAALGCRDDQLPTSHRVVQQVRRILGIRRVGHTGTLDPFASGLLVLCLGKATRLAEYYQALPKTYVAKVLFGVETDTDDVTGQPKAAPRPCGLSQATVDAALPAYLGAQEQVPPAYSARKIQGRRAYALARAGQAVSLPPRPIHIYELAVLQPLRDNELVLRVACSAGTFVRSLARDLGRALGPRACLSGLRRTALGDLRVEAALAPSQLVEQADAIEASSAWLPPGSGLPWPTVHCAPPESRRLGHGQTVRIPLGEGEAAPNDNVIAADVNGRFLGILACTAVPEPGLAEFKARKWLAPSVQP